ncbi:MAG: beta-hydroxyacyl-ACP dehydratase [Nitrospinae bacterium]|nr:beta-hydroxyacyl-ACP dehydratase [Nitrospinota bacterium]
MDIQRAIPHRPPFLFIDEVEEITEESITARYTVRPELPALAGHFPSFPVMPGVLAMESVFQAGAILLSEKNAGLGDAIPALTRVRDARFKRMIRPGDVMTVRAEIENIVSTAYYMKGGVEVEGKLAMSVSFTCALAPRERVSR